MSRPFASEDVFRAIADPTRRGLLDLLRSGPRPVGELVSSFRLSFPAISQHLRVLRHAGLVQQQRVGRHRIYRIHPARLRHVAQWITQYHRLIR